MTAISQHATGHGPAPTPALRVSPGIALDWDDTVGPVPPTLRRRWITLAQARIPTGIQTFALDGEHGLSVAVVGGVLDAPTGHVRFDPYRVLSGGSVDEQVVPDGPHPWRDLDAADIFPCCLLMFPNYETAPAGPDARDPAATRAFVDALLDWCRGQGVRSVGALFLRPDYPEFLDALSGAGFTTVPMVQRCDMAVTWTDFDGYLAGLPRKRRFVVRRELRDIAAHGIVVDERPLRADEPDLLRLRAALVTKYGGVPDERREAESLHHLREHFGADNVMVVQARKGDELISFSLVIRDGDQWTVPMSGNLYDRDDAAFTYFATMFYRPAELAPALGITSIAYGLGTIEAKRLRGCTVSTLLAAARLID